MTRVRLKTHFMPGKPYWKLINDDVPVGKVYKVVYPIIRDGIISNSQINEDQVVGCLFLEDEETGSRGWMVIDVLEPMPGESWDTTLKPEITEIKQETLPSGTTVELSQSKKPH